MSESLFRKEALESRKSHWLGGASVHQPNILWIGTGFTLLAMVAIICFLAFGSYTRRTRVPGQLIPLHGMAEIVAPASGVLKRVQVVEGEHVSAGQILVVVSEPGATLLGGDTALALQKAIGQRQAGLAETFAAQKKQFQAQYEGLTAQIDSTQGELVQIQAQLTTARQQQVLADAALAQLRGLREKQYVTDLQVQEKQVAALDQLGKIQALQQQASSTRRMLAQLTQSRLELPAQISALSANEYRDTAVLQQESVEAQARSEAVIQAPISGTVSTLLGQEGEVVQTGEPVLSLLPEDGRLLAQLLVPGRAVGFVSPGDEVLLRYQAYPYQRFGHYRGKVVSITRNALSPREFTALTGVSTATEPYYRVLVALDRQSILAFGKVERLKPGLLLEADILGERRALWRWLFEPLHTLTGKIGSGE